MKNKCNQLFKRLLLIILSVSLFCISCTRSIGPQKLFAGGFTKGDEKGLSLFEFDKRGNLKLIAEADAGPSPAYFCFSKKHNLIYALNEVMKFKGEFGGGLTTLKYNPVTGIFEKKNELLIPYAGPCYISLSADSTFLLVANYPNGSVAVVRLDNDGIPETITDTILYNKAEPDASHAHMILHNPAGKYIYVTDLGLDRLMIYTLNKSTGKLEQVENGEVTLTKGSGPRHFAFGRDGSMLYIINELGSTIMVFKIPEKPPLELVQVLPTTREGYEDMNYCADIHISSDSRYLYGSNRGENSIVCFKIQPDGTLSLVGHVSCGGDWPRNFVIDPTGKFLLVGNQKSDQISVFEINNLTGMPEGPVNQAVMKTPACLKFWN